MPAFVLRLTRRLTDALAVLGALGVVAMLVHINIDVVLRQLFHWPVPATNEIVSRYYMVMVAFLSLAWADRRGEMIRVEVLSGLLSERLRRPIQIFVYLVCAAAFAVLTWTTWSEAMANLRSGTFVMSLNVAVLVWPSYFVLPVAFALALLVSLVKLAVTLSGGDPDALSDGHERAGGDVQA